MTLNTVLGVGRLLATVNRWIYSIAKYSREFFPVEISFVYFTTFHALKTQFKLFSCSKTLNKTVVPGAIDHIL